MKLIVNGSPVEMEPGITLQRALEILGIRTEFVAVAVNLDCITRSQYAAKELFENDEIEILSPNQGG